MFKLNDYYLTSVRDGNTEFNKNKLVSELSVNDVLVVYKDDVTTYYYAVPSNLKAQIGSELLELFYADNCDYTNDALTDFKDNHSEYFKKSEV